MARIQQLASLDLDGRPARQEMDKVGDAGERMGARVRDGVAKLTPAMVALDAAVGQARQGVEGAAARTGALGAVLTSLGGAGPLAAGAIGGTAALLIGLSSAATNAADQLGEIYTAAQRIGVSTDYLQEMRYAMVQTGEDARIVDATLSRFATKLGELQTGLGQEARGAFRQLGFTDEQIAGFRDVEEVLPLIADRIKDVGSAAQDAALLDKLGLKEAYSLLQQGSEALARTAAAARAAGVVIDEEALRRAWEYGGALDAANAAISANFNAAVVDFLPVKQVFMDALAQIARGAGIVVDRIRELEDRSTAGLERRMNELRETRAALERDFGGDALTDRAGPIGGHSLRGGAANRLGRAREEYREVQREITRIIDELALRDLQAERGRGGRSQFDPLTDPMTSQLQAVLTRVRETAEAREQLAAIEAQSPGIAMEEARARAELAKTLNQLAEARRRNIITSDAELQVARDAATANFEDAERRRERNDDLRLISPLIDRAATATEIYASRVDALNRLQADGVLTAERYARGLQSAADEAQRAAEAATAGLRGDVSSIRSSIETPLERMRREEREAMEAYRQSQALGEGDRLSQEELARRLEQIRDAYRDIADAQRAASIEGKLLNGVLDGQIKSFSALGEELLKLLANAAFDSIRDAGRSAEGGVAGFGSRVLSGVQDRIGFGDLFGRDDEAPASVRDLSAAAKGAAGDLQRALAPSAAQSAIQLGFSARASQIEANSKLQGVAAFGVLTKSATAAAAALQQVAAAGGGDAAGDVLSKVASAFFGGGGYGDLAKGSGSGGVKVGPGRARGGDLWPGYRHPVTEDGRPEILLLGGGGARVLPNEDFEGLRLLADLSRRTSGASAGGGAAGGAIYVNVQVSNQAGGDVEATSTARRNQNGGVDIDVMLRRKTSAEIANGDHDRAMAARFGATPVMVPR